MPFSRYLRSTQVYEAETNIDNFDVQRSWGWEPTGTLEQMRKELRVSIESTVEKSVMDTQIHKSKVESLSQESCRFLTLQALPFSTSSLLLAPRLQAACCQHGTHCEKSSSGEHGGRNERLAHGDESVAYTLIDAWRLNPVFGVPLFLGVRSTIWRFRCATSVLSPPVMGNECICLTRTTLSVRTFPSIRSGFVYEGLDKVGLGCRGRHCAGYAVPPPAPG